MLISSQVLASERCSELYWWSVPHLAKRKRRTNCRLLDFVSSLRYFLIYRARFCPCSPKLPFGNDGWLEVGKFMLKRGAGLSPQKGCIVLISPSYLYPKVFEVFVVVLWEIHPSWAGSRATSRYGVNWVLEIKPKVVFLEDERICRGFLVYIEVCLHWF